MTTAVAILLALAQDAELPRTEKELFDFATARVHREGWKDADRAFKRFLEAFPRSEKTERVLSDLATLHLWHSDRFAEARDLYVRLTESFPKSPKYWDYRLGIPEADTRLHQRGKALEELKKIAREAPEGEARALAIRRAWILQDKVFDLVMDAPAAWGEEPAFKMSLRNVPGTTFRVTHVRHDAVPPGAALAQVGAEGRRALKEWTATWTYEKGQAWRVETVRIPSTESGFYLVQAEHDGVVRTATLVHHRYELIARVAAGRVACVVRERGTSKPAAGAVVRIDAVEGRTDAEGLFSGRYRGGRVQALKDGERLSVRPVYEGRPAPPVLLEAPVVWSHAVEGGDALDKARPEPRRTSEPAHQKDSRTEWEREADRGGALPELIADEASWKKAAAFLEAPMDGLRPDFTKERWVVVVLDPHASLKGAFEEAGAIKVWIHTVIDHPGTRPVPGGDAPAPRKREVRILKLPKNDLDVVILDDVLHILRPIAPPPR